MRKSFAVALVVMFCLCGVSAESPAQSAGWSEGTRETVLTAVEAALTHYYFVDRVPKMQAAIEANRSSLIRIQNPNTFAEAVTKVLYTVAHDKHIELMYSPDAMPDFSKPSRADLADAERADRFDNFGLDAGIRLHGNVGYLWVDAFPDNPQSAYDAAMNVLARTDAMIIDMRDNGGGSARGVNYLLAFFFAKRVEVTGFLTRSKGSVTLQRHYTATTVGAPRYLDKPLFVLISNQTFSGGEQFAYDLKSLHRAELVGQSTGGGANPVDAYRLNNHFAISVPFGTAHNPYTETNWEGVGVAPDIDAPTKSALLVAYVRALKAIKNSWEPGIAARARALKDPAAALAQSLPVH